ncbi:MULTISPECIES: thioredoxin [Flammeovirga]|uniref:Thioredoxin n=2 Tax=Flammeovirga TaxID=59739 RepID=A0A3Q9FTJ3_9BACT|nr:MULTISPECIES: thioredoxin [Flammeovirga]AZQ64290.1 thioredoxin [Flammeovirga pectinis]MBB6462694.1 thioredoxin 1 [Flammeovirga kamogawensis]QWG06070.1 thioredoxin [Flammeovirga kamogawensis]TRX67903.1 thioredoxin [Flammeovirga kamogawensis]
MKAIQNIEEYNQLIANSNNTPVLLDFYADWCGPCQTLLPTVEKLSKEYEGKVTIQKVNIEAVPELATLHKVRSIPNLVFIKNEKVVNTHIGLASEADLRTNLDTLSN